MSNFTKILSIFIISLVFSFNTSATGNNDPDFAYPLQVSQQAESNLKKALKDNDGNAVVKSLIEHAVAIDKINSDSIQSTINKIETIASKEKNPCTKALLNSLLLEIYCNIYDSNSYTFESRVKVGTDTPADINEWSKADFTNKINTLCSEILKDSADLKKAPLKNYGDIITHNNITYTFYPTLYDFAIYNIIINIDDAFIEETSPTPRIENIDSFLSSKNENSNEFRTLINSLFRDILTFHAHDVAPLINWEINRLEFENDLSLFSNHDLTEQNTYALNYLYKKYENSEYATDALLKLFDETYCYAGTHKPLYSNKELFSILSTRLKEFPAYYNNCLVNKCLNELTQERIEIRYNNVIIPNDSLFIEIENDNTKQYVVEIHRLPEDITAQYYTNDYFDASKSLKTQIINRFEIQNTHEAPFSQIDTIKAVISQPGYYTIVAYIDSVKQHIHDRLIRCTNYQIIDIDNKQFEDKRLWVINPKTGSPIANTKVAVYDHNAEIINTITSRIDGKTNLSLKPGRYIFKAYDETDKYSAPSNLYIYNANKENDTNEIAKANIFTSLPIYHPGDSIDWSAVIYNEENNESQLCKNRTFTITLRDANYMELDTLMATTDSFGRIEGKFLIPTDRLTGNYTINIVGNFNRVIGRCSFMVSDYKLPTFDIKISNIGNNQNGTYTIGGIVKSFSDFAIEGATVTISFSDIFNPTPITFNGSILTDSEGKFSFTIPKNEMPSSQFFKANITATSITGESQTASRNFSIGNQFYISYSQQSPIEASKSIAINAKILNLNGDNVNGKIHYILTNDKKQEIKQGAFSTTSPTVDWSKVPSGKYEIKLYSIAPTSTDTISTKITLYRLTDKTPPCDYGLWIQNKEYTITKGNSVDIYYGSAFNDCDVLYLLYDNDKIYEQRWIKTKKGIHKTRVFMPQNVNNAKLLLYTLTDYILNSYSTITIKRADANKSIKITAESFRDKIIPGSEEQWRFNVTDNSGNGSESAMIFDMYSLAIDKIKKHNFNLNFPSFDYISDIIIKNYKSPLFINLVTPLKSYRCPYITEPKLYTFNHSIGRQNIRNIIYAYGMARAAKSIATQNDELVVENEVVYEKKSLNYASVSLIPESVEPNISLRENEIPLAFFRPMLTTDTLGNLSFSFTVPNANTTWRFNAIAYNNNMEVASFTRDVIANKPLMAQPNMPRFLRQGDETTIKASVMNNSDNSLTITTIIELFDPTTSKTIAIHRQTDTIAASQSAIASITLTAPTDAAMIGYRIKSFSDNFGDGEQSLIPILPASSPVIESTTFYMGSDEKSTIIQLPTIPENARVTLEFCENPTWYAVSALPGLRKGESRTAISAINNIYSVAIADGIVRKNPQIANALYQWQYSNKNDSTLVSMLSRNEDLKNMLLNSTPWVEDANNDTERMARLALLFNKKEIKSTIDKNIHLLATLQRNGGGWAWIAESEKASTWATLSILEKIGHLKRLGYLPNSKDLNSMIENAVKYIDAEFAQQFKKYSNGNYSQYVFIRDMFPEYRQSTAAQRVTNATVQQIINNWKTYNLGGKAIAAMILNNNGYSSTAQKILSSINQFAQSTPSKGMWWPSVVNSLDYNIDKNLVQANILDAYHQINPSNKNIDLIRQWLIINKEANDWGNSIATSYVIYTLLNTGTSWTKPAVGCEISLNGEQITPSHFETITGYLRADISSLSPSGKKLTVAKHGNNPSWGAIYRQYEATMTEINAVAGNDISINKSILKQVGDAWLPTDTFAIGDRVRIQLTIKTYRDIEYVSISDERAACFEPTEQLPRALFAEGICFYRENRDNATNIFVSSLPKGTYLLTYDMFVNNQGTFSSGIATIQSQYAPQITAHSAGEQIVIE